VRRILIVHPRLADFRGTDVERFRPLLASLGLRLVLADERTDVPLAGLFDERIRLPPAHAVERGWRVLAFELESRPVDALLTQTESALPYGALAARAFDLCGPSCESVRLCLDKHACRTRLAEAGLEQPRFALARDARAVRQRSRAWGLPLVLKAVASANQRLVTLVCEPGQIDDAVARLRAGMARSADLARLEGFARAAGIELGCDVRREFLVESYAPGDPLETDGVVFGSEVHGFGVTEQVHAAAPDIFIEGYLSPADRAPAECERVERATRQALAAVGLRDSGYSIEFRSNAKRSSLIEINGRLGCDEGFGDLFEATIGVQPMYVALQATLGIAPSFMPTGRRAALAYRACYTASCVRSVPVAHDLARCADAGVRAAVHVTAGEHTRAADDLDVHPHLASALASDPRSSRAAYRRARAAVDALTFELEPLAGG
jgi:cysteine synthase A